MKLLNKSILIAAVALLSLSTYAQEEEEPAPYEQLKEVAIEGTIEDEIRPIFS